MQGVDSAPPVPQQPDHKGVLLASVPQNVVELRPGAYYETVNTEIGAAQQSSSISASERVKLQYAVYGADGAVLLQSPQDAASQWYTVSDIGFHTLQTVVRNMTLGEARRLWVEPVPPSTDRTLDLGDLDPNQGPQQRFMVEVELLLVGSESERIDKARSATASETLSANVTHRTVSSAGLAQVSSGFDAVATNSETRQANGVWWKSEAARKKFALKYEVCW